MIRWKYEESADLMSPLFQNSMKFIFVNYFLISENSYEGGLKRYLCECQDGYQGELLKTCIPFKLIK